MLNKLVTPLRWGIGGLKKTVGTPSPCARPSKPPLPLRVQKLVSSLHPTDPNTLVPTQVRGLMGSPSTDDEAPRVATPAMAQSNAAQVRVSPRCPTRPCTALF